MNVCLLVDDTPLSVLFNGFVHMFCIFTSSHKNVIKFYQVFYVHFTQPKTKTSFCFFNYRILKILMGGVEKIEFGIRDFANKVVKNSLKLL